MYHGNGLVSLGSFSHIKIVKVYFKHQLLRCTCREEDPPLSLVDWHPTWLYISGRAHPGGLQRSFSSQYLECSFQWQVGHQICFPGKYQYWLYLTYLQEKSLAPRLAGAAGCRGPFCDPGYRGCQEGLQSARVLSKVHGCLVTPENSSEKCSMSMTPYATETKSFHPIIITLTEATGPASA